MTDSPTDDKPGFVAKEPVHCFACFRLVRPGQTYYLTVGQAILCEDCITGHDTIRVTVDLAVLAEDEWLPVRNGGSAVEVPPWRGVAPGGGVGRGARLYREGVRLWGNWTAILHTSSPWSTLSNTSTSTGCCRISSQMPL